MALSSAWTVRSADRMSSMKVTLRLMGSGRGLEHLAPHVVIEDTLDKGGLRPDECGAHHVAPPHPFEDLHSAGPVLGIQPFQAVRVVPRERVRDVLRCA